MATQIALDFGYRRELARITDPTTSKAAAVAAEDFIASHDGKIVGALKGAAAGLIKDEIAQITKLTDIQVARRLSSLEERRAVHRARVQREGSADFDYVTRQNVRGRPCAVWYHGPAPKDAEE